jgi:AraC-like DNA-binding protein
MKDDDLLGHVLEQTSLRGRVFCQTEARAPWALRFDRQPGAAFHLVTSGTCWLTAGRRQRQLVAGDLVLLARGTTHVLGDDPARAPVALADWLGGGARPLGGTGASGAACRVLCGMFAFDTPPPGHPVLELLPEVIHLTGDGVRERPALAATVDALVREHAQVRSGTSLVVSRLLDVLFVQVLRAWTDAQPEGGAGWLGALDDAVLARALGLLHRDLARPWTVETLARAAGCARATLARRFVARVGQAPLAYLARVRLREAARRLARSTASLAEVGAQVGYGSEFAFNRAFRRELGVPPGRYRERARSEAEAAAPVQGGERRRPQRRRR